MVLVFSPPAASLIKSEFDLRWPSLKMEPYAVPISLSYIPGPILVSVLIFESLQFGTFDRKIALRPYALKFFLSVGS